MLFTRTILLATLVLTSGILAAQTFPDASLKTLDRREVALSDYVGNGKNTVVAVWTTTCPNCIIELDHMKDYVEKWAAEYNAEVIAVSMDQRERIRKVRPMVSGRQWPYTILLDNHRKLSKLLDFTKIPQLFVVDARGRIVRRYESYQQGREIEVDRLLASLR